MVEWRAGRERERQEDLGGEAQPALALFLV